MHGEYALDPDARGNPADGEVGGWALAIVQPNYDTLEGLDALALTLADAEVDADGIAGGEPGNTRIGFCFVYFSSVHCRVSIKLWLMESTGHA